MAKRSSREAEPRDPLDQVMFTLDAEQTSAFLKVMNNPPSANEALKALMKRAPVRGEGTEIEDTDI